MACQENEEEGEEVDEEAEFDGMLIESAGDVIPIMAKLVGGENFLTFFAGFLPDLLKRMVSVANCLGSIFVSVFVFGFILCSKGFS